MNKVLLESSIDDTLDSIEYMIEKENKENNKKEEDKNNEEDQKLKERKKKLIKRITALIVVGTSALAAINTFMKSKEYKKTKNNLTIKMGNLVENTKDTKDQVEKGLKELKVLKADLEVGNKLGSEKYIKSAENIADKVDDVFNHALRMIDESLKYQSKITNNIENFAKINPLTTSRKKINKAANIISMDISGEKKYMRNLGGKMTNMTDEVKDLKRKVRTVNVRKLGVPSLTAAFHDKI